VYKFYLIFLVVLSILTNYYPPFQALAFDSMSYCLSNISFFCKFPPCQVRAVLLCSFINYLVKHTDTAWFYSTLQRVL